MRGLVAAEGGCRPSPKGSICRAVRGVAEDGGGPLAGCETTGVRGVRGQINVFFRRHFFCNHYLTSIRVRTRFFLYFAR